MHSTHTHACTHTHMHTHVHTHSHTHAHTHKHTHTHTYIHGTHTPMMCTRSPSRQPYAFYLDRWGIPQCRGHLWTCAWLLWRHGRPGLQWPPGATPSQDPLSLLHTVPASIQPAWLPCLCWSWTGKTTGQWSMVTTFTDNCNDHYLL